MSRLVIAIFVWLIVFHYGIGSRVVNSDENIKNNEQLTQLIESAKQGGAFSQYILGEYYYFGVGVVQNYRE